MWQMVAGRLVRVVMVAGVLAAGLGFVGASGAAAQSVADVEVRDRLVADQEACERLPVHVRRGYRRGSRRLRDASLFASERPGSPSPVVPLPDGPPSRPVIADQSALLNVTAAIE